MSQFSTFEKCRPAPKESGIGGWPWLAHGQNHEIGRDRNKLTEQRLLDCTLLELN
jgi:hypothetical protein